MKTFYKIFLIILITIQVYSQSGNVIVQLRQPPAYKFALEDMWKVTLNNSSKSIYNVYLYGTVSRTGAGEIVQGTTSKFQLPPGTKIVQPNDISPINVKEPNKDYENVLKRTGTVPNGDYEICLTVYDADNNTVIGEECLNFSVQTVTQTALVSPIDEATISERLPVFSWQPPSPVRSTQNVRYRLSVVEILGIQSAYDAMESNPEFHQIDNLIGTVYQYPPSSKFFQPGRKYAWQITSYLDGFILCKSDVWEFVYSDNSRTGENVGKHSPIYHLPSRPNYSLSIESIRRLRLNINKTEIENNIESASRNSLIQKKPTQLFLFSGTSELYGEAANRFGKFSKEPQRFADWNIDPTLNIKGIPFGLNLLFSTKENVSKDKQNINSLSFGFDPSKLKDIVEEKVKDYLESRKDEVEQKIKEKGEQYRDKIESETKDNYMKSLALPYKIFNAINTLGLGVTYPSYSKYTLSGVPVTGLNFEFNPGIFYISVTGFNNKKPIENKTFKRNLYAGKLGVGKKDKSHLYFSLLYAKDNENSIKVADTNSVLKPAANYVLSTEAKLNLLKNKLSIEGEVAVSLLTSDITAPDIVSSAIPSWIKNIFKPKNSSSFDGFYTGKISFDNPVSNSKTYLKVMMIGPGYRSLGSSSTLNDMLRFEFKLDQKFMNNKISASIQLFNDRDNLIDLLKPYRTVNSSGIINFSVAIPQMPRVSIIYNPSFVSNNSSNDADKTDNKIQNLTLISSYQFKVSNVTIINQLNAGLTDNTTYKSINDGFSRNISLTETFLFKIPLTLTGRFGITQTLDKLLGYNRIILSEFSASFAAKEYWTGFMSVNFDVSKEQSKRIGFAFDNLFELGKNISINIRMEKNINTDWINGSNNFDEFVFKSTLSTNW
ncbi:MAG: hypothetical protein EHM58_08245 [Ignavibacteriae bacterium]|nr:MAG: hypothetical protein EHM58_08245 [Ignavibacteriota bacterium]